jgi:hypothetical protein
LDLLSPFLDARRVTGGPPGLAAVRQRERWTEVIANYQSVTPHYPFVISARERR